MAREFGGLAQFAAFLDELALEQPGRLLATAGAASLIIQHQIKGVFGNKEKLAPLAQSTIDAREKLGDPDPDAPLYGLTKAKDGSIVPAGTIMRDSIQAEHAQYGPEGAIAGVGSNEQIVVWHETGAGNYPPRPAFAIGVYEAMPVVREAFRAIMGSRLVLKSARSSKFASVKPGRVNYTALSSALGETE